MKKLTVIFIFMLVLFGCSKQRKAEQAVNNFIEKFATYPDSYEPIEFLELEECNEMISGYKLGVMYRIKGADGLLKVETHEFKLTDEFNVYVDMFEKFE